MKSYITYLRVSTSKQGADGLGIDAQRNATTRFVGTAGVVLSEYVEVESGKHDKRPKLLEAIAAAKSAGATLLIAKLDRLSRNAAFIFQLRDSKVDFICADMPDATSLTIGIFAVLAQNERELISTRTKAALEAKKLRGEKLGNADNLTAEARILGRQQQQENARTAKENVQAAHMIKMMRTQNQSYQVIADKLNALGYATRRGCKFTSCAVQRLAK